MDEAAIRKIYANREQANLAHKLARARAVLDHSHEKAPVMWALVELDTETEARIAADARVEALALSITRGLVSDLFDDHD